MYSRLQIKSNNKNGDVFYIINVFRTFNVMYVINLLLMVKDPC